MADEKGKFLAERHRMAFLLIGMLNQFEICVSKVRNGFIDKKDCDDAQSTIDRLHTELLEVDKDLAEELNKES